MKLHSPFLAATLAAGCLAFPTEYIHQLGKREGILDGLLDATSDVLQSVAKDINNALASVVSTNSTLVDVTGEHAFQAPSSTAQRGPCPGLNALANHGYISRDGIASLVEVVPALTQVYNMGIDLALILGVLGVVWTGNPISLDPSFSIGGNSTAVENLLDNLGGILGTPQGIDYSHNLIESDSSPTRNDLYQTGDAWTMNFTRFQEWYDMVPAGGHFTLDVMAEFAAKRYNESVATNPNFYYGPFTGMIARNAGFLFITRLFANHADGSADGVLDHETIKSFFGVYGDEGNMTYKAGWEQIPQNWHHVPVAYGLVGLNLDTVDMVLKYPQLANIGGNTGTVNSFAGVDLTDVLGGVLNAGQLLEGNNLLCFALEVVKLASPNYLSNLYSLLAVPLSLVNDILAVPILSLACPQWKDLTMGGEPFMDALTAKYPGANMSSRAL